MKQPDKVLGVEVVDDKYGRRYMPVVSLNDFQMPDRRLLFAESSHAALAHDILLCKAASLSKNATSPSTLLLNNSYEWLLAQPLFQVLQEGTIEDTCNTLALHPDLLQDMLPHSHSRRRRSATAAHVPTTTTPLQELKANNDRVPSLEEVEAKKPDNTNVTFTRKNPKTPTATAAEKHQPRHNSTVKLTSIKSGSRSTGSGQRRPRKKVNPYNTSTIPAAPAATTDTATNDSSSLNQRSGNWTQWPTDTTHQCVAITNAHLRAGSISMPANRSATIFGDLPTTEIQVKLTEADGTTTKYTWRHARYDSVPKSVFLQTLGGFFDAVDANAGDVLQFKRSTRSRECFVQYWRDGSQQAEAVKLLIRFGGHVQPSTPRVLIIEDREEEEDDNEEEVMVVNRDRHGRFVPKSSDKTPRTTRKRGDKLVDALIIEDSEEEEEDEEDDYQQQHQKRKRKEGDQKEESSMLSMRDDASAACSEAHSAAERRQLRERSALESKRRKMYDVSALMPKPRAKKSLSANTSSRSAAAKKPTGTSTENNKPSSRATSSASLKPKPALVSFKEEEDTVLSSPESLGSPGDEYRVPYSSRYRQQQQAKRVQDCGGVNNLQHAAYSRRLQPYRRGKQLRVSRRKPKNPRRASFGSPDLAAYNAALSIVMMADF